MPKYKAIDYFQWGDIKFEKGQILIINEFIIADKNHDWASVVHVEHYPDKTQVVGTKSIESMISLKNIEEY